MRRRGSRIEGKKLPLRSFGIPSWRSPALVDRTRGRCPLRCVRARSARSHGSAPIASGASSSINCCSAHRANSRTRSVPSPGASASSRSETADSVQSHRRELLRVHFAGTHKDHAGGSPHGGPPNPTTARDSVERRGTNRRDERPPDRRFEVHGCMHTPAPATEAQLSRNGNLIDATVVTAASLPAREGACPSLSETCTPTTEPDIGQRTSSPVPGWQSSGRAAARTSAFRAETAGQRTAPVAFAGTPPPHFYPAATFRSPPSGCVAGWADNGGGSTPAHHVPLSTTRHRSAVRPGSFRWRLTGGGKKFRH